MAGDSAFLDRPVARIVALLICVGALGALAVIHWNDLVRPAAVSAKGEADDPFVRCFAQRRGEIGQMVKDGVLDAQRAALFETRAEAMCRAQNAK